MTFLLWLNGFVLHLDGHSYVVLLHLQSNRVPDHQLLQKHFSNQTKLILSLFIIDNLTWCGINLIYLPRITVRNVQLNLYLVQIYNPIENKYLFTFKSHTHKNQICYLISHQILSTIFCPGTLEYYWLFLFFYKTANKFKTEHVI